ncbi:MAG: 2-hydroxyacid dehydrogenase [Marinibacterium sp.]
MPVTILFAAICERWEIWQAPLRAALDGAGLDYDLVTDAPAGEVDYIIYAPDSAVQDFTPFTRLKAVLNLWAGVETVIGNPTLRVPLARMVDPGLTEGMTEWVVGHVLRHHLGMDPQIHGLNVTWQADVPPLARDRQVTILGLGALGAASAAALAALNFNVAGWSRSPRTLPEIATFHGAEGLDAALARAEILVLLLPLTAATDTLITGDRLARMPRGAVLINPGRGALIDDDALLAALDSGRIGHATLDVFRTEPLPPAHPFWAHPRVTVTPHIASQTRPVSAARTIAENIRRGEAGEPFLHLADREQGY